jgi:hypothetical protein
MAMMILVTPLRIIATEGWFPWPSAEFGPLQPQSSGILWLRPSRSRSTAHKTLTSSGAGQTPYSAMKSDLRPVAGLTQFWALSIGHFASGGLLLSALVYRCDDENKIRKL